MLNTLFKTTTIPVLEQVVNFSQARHNVLAGNIANIDTPGYRMNDLSPEKFQARLAEALQQRDQQPSQASLSPGHLTADPVAAVGNSLANLLHHDDTNGSLEDQVTSIAKNQMQNNLAIALMTSQFRLLQSAISERA